MLEQGPLLFRCVAFVQGLGLTTRPAYRCTRPQHHKEAVASSTSGFWRRRRELELDFVSHADPGLRRVTNEASMLCLAIARDTRDLVHLDARRVAR